MLLERCAMRMLGGEKRVVANNEVLGNCQRFGTENTTGLRENANLRMIRRSDESDSRKGFRWGTVEGNALRSRPITKRLVAKLVSEDFGGGIWRWMMLRLGRRYPDMVLWMVISGKEVSPWKGVIRFRERGKLGPRYIGPYRIVAQVGKVAYRLGLPEQLSQIHDMFHVSQLRKCITDETTIVPLEDIQIDKRLNYVERPVAIIERKTKTLRNKMIGLVKVQWQHRKGFEWTWEPEEEMQRHYPELFTGTDFGDGIQSSGGEL
ncbi:hypothetical protein L2E82_35039 [Cichorium intybus]|uniref:Uncharacterized protein n=1 Tax=Cichorium intybus TaxID=13427 RepID=A0ACB9BN69_CICIN|nr:hypothetical protein L2E82_35039 [Cichorium intybus]